MEKILYINLGNYSYDYYFNSDLELFEAALAFWEMYPNAVCSIYKQPGYLALTISDDDWNFFSPANMAGEDLAH